MRGIITLAAAAGVPLTNTSGSPMHGREIILAVAFVITIATLLIQGSTLPILARKLNLDLDADARLEERRMQRAMRIAESVHTSEIPDAADTSIYQLRRSALIAGVINDKVDDESAQKLIHEIDLAEALTNVRRLEHG